MHDTIIIGGGPIGSYTAQRLAEKGHKVLVLERKAGVGGKACCTGIIGQECVNTFNINDKVILKKINSATLFSPSGKTIHLYRKEPQAVVLDRQAFDKVMAERAQRAGAEYEFNSRAIEITIGNDRASVTVSSGGKSHKTSAKVVVIASGFSPGFNERAGLGEYKDYVTGAQAEVEAPGLEEVEGYFGG